MIDLIEIEKYRKLGLIDEIALRNYLIRKEFEELRAEKIKSMDVLDMLADKHCLSVSSINTIIYGKK